MGLGAARSREDDARRELPGPSEGPDGLVSVDAGDADVATVFYYLAQAAPPGRPALPPFTPEYRAGLGLFARRYFRELYRRLRVPFTLVFDNDHEAPDDAPLHDVLREAAEELPSGGRVIVVAGHLHPPPSRVFNSIRRSTSSTGRDCG